MSGLTRRIYGYNPLVDFHLLDDVWVCVKTTPFRTGPSVDAPEKPYNLEAGTDGKHLIDNVPEGAEVFGKREGNWIKLNDCDLYVEAKNDSTRYFKNKKIQIWEGHIAGGDHVARRPSNASDLTFGSESSTRSSTSKAPCVLM